MEETDELWMRHCQRDFKHGSPQEYESWREMYLRLHDEREERLRMLTQNISSAHANRPKGTARARLPLPRGSPRALWEMHKATCRCTHTCTRANGR